MGFDALGLLVGFDLLIEIFHAGDEGGVGMSYFLVGLLEEGDVFFKRAAVFFKLKSVIKFVVKSLFKFLKLIVNLADLGLELAVF